MVNKKQKHGFSLIKSTNQKIGTPYDECLNKDLILRKAIEEASKYREEIKAILKLKIYIKRQPSYLADNL